MAEEAEERCGEAEERRGVAEASGDPVYRTKAVQFLGRATPIVLQNENGPCPLLAICIFLFFFQFLYWSMII
jgi:ubiquitin carboxyl-terminal hydrolase MINDY-1/2